MNNPKLVEHDQHSVDGGKGTVAAPVVFPKDSSESAAPTLKLLSVKTYVLHCYSCKRWVGRMPQWDNGELGHGWQCEHCGNTSTTTREGRPFGPRYRYWQSLVDEFADYERLNMLTGKMGEWILETVNVEQHSTQQ